MVQSWECSKCTFRHQALALRCVMCNELRISREQMRDFIQGKTMLAAREQNKNEKEKEPSVEHLSSVAQNDKALRKIADDTAVELTTSTARKPFNPYSSKTTTGPPTDAPLHIGPTQGKAALPPLTQQHRKKNFTAAATNGVAHSLPQPTAAPVTKPIAKVLSAAQNINQNNGNRKRPRSAAGTTLKKKNDLPYQPGVVPLAESFADTWIYPSAAAYPKRQYQFEMTQSAIRQNTLVSLPTGLGKTLIAAVVMYNYYRWFPKGKVLFLAPTLPLVDQQVQACYEIMGIPAQDTALLTGKVPAAQRTIIWQEKRVFFCTPQTVQKDLEMSRCESSKVVCVVLDEAHKSTGGYAYCKVISYLEQSGAKFRILGLSATPGTSIKAVQQIIDVLRINCIEARSDDDSDVKQYIHERQNEVIIVPGSVATKEVEQLVNDIIAPILDILRNRNILPGGQNANHTSISSYTLLKSQQFIKGQPPHERYNSALGYLAAGVCFLQIRSDLHKHGIGTVRSKLYKLQNDRPKGVLATIVKGKPFQLLWEEVEKVSCNPNAAENTVQDKLRNNPKLIKLREILTEHFERAKACSTSSRVIVFSQFRTSVFEIVNVLNESKPLIRARHFIGQGKGSSTKSTGNTNEVPIDVPMEGMKQDEQKNVIKRFKDGVYNTLVCTSIGEEGCTFFTSWSHLTLHSLCAHSNFAHIFALFRDSGYWRG
jgi:fanconi anemia group M protein